MKNATKLLNQFKKGLNDLTKNADTTQLKNQLNSASEQMKQTLNSTSKQMKKSLNKHYENIPQYKSQIQSQVSKLTKHSKQKNTEFQQKFHEFSQSNPTIKQYHSKYQTQMNKISKNIPNLNVKQSIDSTVKQTKKIAANVQSTAKQISDQSQKVTSSVSSGISSTKHRLSNISPSKMAASATKPISSTFKATQKILNPNRWTTKLFAYLSKIKTSIMIYGCIGIASLMIINQVSYMALLYMIRHRYDENKQFKLFGIDMVWLYQWLNIPYSGDIHHQRAKLGNKQEDGDGDGNVVGSVLDERQIQDYNITADIKLAKMAYNGLLYPRIGAAILLTAMIGTPLLRIVFWFKR